MGFLDILSGALGGVSQGLGQMQDQRKQQAQLLMQQQNQKLQQDEAKRRAVMEAYSTLQGGQEVDPQQASEFKAMGLGGLTAQGGKIIKMKSPQEQQIELVLQTRQLEMDEQKKKTAFLDKLHNDGNGFYAMPIGQRQAEALAAGFDDPSIVLSPQEKLKFSPQVAAAQISAGPRYAAAQASASALPTKQAAANKANAMKMAMAMSKTPMGQTDPEQLQTHYESILAELNGQPRAKSGPAVGTRGKVGGVPAVWDGTNWVEE